MESEFLLAKIAELEGRLASLEGKSGVEAHGFDSPSGGSGKETSDPKGRKVWEAEWDATDQSMKAYIPKGAVVVGNTPLDVDVEGTRESDEVKLTGGVWYLHVHKKSAKLNQTETEGATSGSEEGSSEAAQAEGSEEKEDDPLIFETKIIEISEKGDYVVNQFAIGVITVQEPGKDVDFELGAEAEAESVESGEEADADVDVEEKTETKPKTLVFKFKIPKGEEGKSIKSASLTASETFMEGVGYDLKIFLEGDEKEENPIVLANFIGVRGDDSMLFIAGNETGVTLAGTSGETPYIGGNGNWWIGEEDTGVKAQGEKGEPGDSGALPEGMREVRFCVDAEEILRLIGTDDIDITRTQIAAGTGIRVDEENGVITISAEETEDDENEGYTTGDANPRKVVLDVKYDLQSHALMKQTQREYWRGGKLERVSSPEWEVFHVAVKETV